MKKEKMLVAAVTVLFLLNIGTLGFLFFNKPPKPPGLGPKQLDRMIVEKLSLNPSQTKAFEQLKTTHEAQMIQLDKEFKLMMENYFSLLKNDVVLPAQQDSLQAILSQIQTSRTQVTFQHFAELKALCSPDQRSNFDALIPDLLQVIVPQKPKRPGKRPVD